MFMSVTPTFAATSTNDGNSSVTAISSDVPRSNHRGTEAQTKRARVALCCCAFVVNFSSPELRLDLPDQALILCIIFIENDCALSCVQRIGQFPTPEVSHTQAKPAFGVEWICCDRTS